MKYENNWQFKTLENLEREYWGEAESDSHLVKTCHKLRKKPLSDFGTEDLRIMVGQNIGLKFLVPLALEKLEKNIFAEGDFYQGDLLESVLKSDKEFWSKESEIFASLEAIIVNNKDLLNIQNSKLVDSFLKLKKGLTS